MPEVEIGTIQHYFDKAGAAVINITNGELSVGDKIHIKGHTTDITLNVPSIQIEHQALQTAKQGEAVGVKIGQKVRQNDKVFKITP